MPASLALVLLFVCAVAAQVCYAQTPVYEENFDGASPPAGPEGWVLGDGWTTSRSAPSPGSGVNNLVHRGSDASFATLPPVDLSTADFATLTYLARRTSSYETANLRITASADGGASFPTILLGEGAAVPGSASRYEAMAVSLPASLVGEPDVVIRFEGGGLSGSSSNARIDDVAVEAYAPGEAAGTLGFGAGSGETVAAGDTVDVPVRLEFAAPQGLQALQFRVSWSVDSLEVADVVPGESVADEDAWSLSFEEGSQSLEVVLLGEGTTSLSSGTYENLVTLRIRVEAVPPSDEQLVLTEVVGALATPDGTDAGLLPANTAFGLHFGSDAPEFGVTPAFVDVGSAYVGETARAEVAVSNRGESTDLTVFNAAASNSLFEVEPASGVIVPGDSMQFVISFTPTDTAFGLQQAEVRFEHDGEGAATSIAIIGKGRGGRGDAEGDGTVDVLDIVHVIDFVLARISPEPAQTAAADLFPFPVGDQVLDVRDLTVLSQAVARAQWPDGVRLPEEAEPAGKASAAGPQAWLQRGETGSDLLELVHDVPIRAFQLVVPAEPRAFAVLSPNLEDEISVWSGFDEGRGELRVVAYTPDGETVGAGVQRLEVAARVGPPRYVTVIGEDRSRIPVDVRLSSSTYREERDVAILSPPFPNPFHARREVLRIPLEETGGEVDIYDVLGRRVLHARSQQPSFEWDGRDAAGRAAAAGLYVTRIRSGGSERTFTVVLVR